MDEIARQLILDKNRKIIDMVVERAKRDFPDDIALIGLTGSFNTGDFHERSDLDLIIVNVTERGWGISSCFILGDVGYDIYCTPWEPRIEAQASLESPMVSCLIDLQILYCAKPEYQEKFEAYRNRALASLSKPIGKECIDRAKKFLDAAMREYGLAMLSDDLNEVRSAAGAVLCNLTNAVVKLNNGFFKRGIKRYLEELAAFRYVPVDFQKRYMAVVDAKTIAETREAAGAMLRCALDLYDRMRAEFAPRPAPTKDSLRGSYEELWCNYRNKVIAGVEAKDKSYAYHAALGAQTFLDEMAEDKGTRKLDLMRHFDSDDLEAFEKAFLRAMDEYLEEYKKVGRGVERYDSFEGLYSRYMES